MKILTRLEKWRKKKYAEQINNNNKKIDQQNKLKEEQNNAQVKSLEEEIKNLKLKLADEEKKRNEFEDKAKKLEEENKNIKINAVNKNINNNVNPNLSNNIEKKEENNDNQNQNNKSLFVSNIEKDKDNRFLHNPEEQKPSKQKSIFDISLQNSTDDIFKSFGKMNVNEQSNNQSNNQNSIQSNNQSNNQTNNQTNNISQNITIENLFKESSTNNISKIKIFSSNQNNDKINIFNFNTQNTGQPTQGNQGGLDIFKRNQNQNPKPQTNNIFGTINSSAPTNTEIFKNFTSTTQTNTNPLEQGQTIFGEHANLGGFGSGTANTNNQRKVLHFGTSNATNNANNNTSPFGGFSSGFGTGLFNNQNTQNKPNNDNEYF